MNYGIASIVFFHLTAPSVAFAAHWYVDPLRDGDGRSAATAYPSLDDALDSASDGDTIWLSEDIHQPPMRLTIRTDGLTIAGTGQGSYIDASDSGRAFDLAGDGATLVNLIVVGRPGSSSVLVRGKGSHILNSEFRNGIGVVFQSGGAIVENCIFDQSQMPAIIGRALRNRMPIELLGNTFEYGDQPGAPVQFDGPSLLMIDNEFRSVGRVGRHAVSVRNAPNVRILRNRFLDGDKDGITLDHVDDVRVTSNVFEGSILTIREALDVQVDHNTFFAVDTSRYGIELRNDEVYYKDPAAIRNNLFVGRDDNHQPPLVNHSRADRAELGGNATWEIDHWTSGVFAYSGLNMFPMLGSMDLRFDGDFRPRVAAGYDLEGLRITDNPDHFVDLNGTMRPAVGWAGAAEPRRWRKLETTYSPREPDRKR